MSVDLLVDEFSPSPSHTQSQTHIRTREIGEREGERERENTNVLFRRPEPLLNGCKNKTIIYHVMTLHNAAAHMYTGLIQSRSAITLLAQ